MSNQYFQKSTMESIFSSLKDHHHNNNNSIGMGLDSLDCQVVSIRPLKEKYENINQLDSAIVSKLLLQLNNSNNNETTSSIQCINYIIYSLEFKPIDYQININGIFNQIFIEVSTSIIKSNFNGLIVSVQLLGLILEIESSLINYLFNQFKELPNEILDHLAWVYLYLLNHEDPLIRFINVNQRKIFVNSITSFTTIFNKDFTSFYNQFIKIKSSYKSNYSNQEYIKNNIYEDQLIKTNIKYYCN